MGWKRTLTLGALCVGGAVLFLTGDPKGGPDGHPFPWEEARKTSLETKKAERRTSGAALVRAIDKPSRQPQKHADQATPLQAARQAEAPVTEPADAQTTQAVPATQTTHTNWVRVVGTSVNVRAGPSSVQPRLRSHQLNTRLQVLKQTGRWVYVRDPETSSTGWMFNRYLEKIESPDQRVTGRDGRGSPG
ncbi:MAG: SH3 domain-containing protein [Methyloligellaceae bacterium]